MPFVFPDAMSLTEILSLAVASILVNNYILVQFLGCCSFFGVSKKTDTAIGMGMAVVFVMALSSAVTWAVQYFILEPLNLQYMQTIAFILVIATLVQFVEMFMKKSMPALYSALGIFLPLITTNCAVLGAAISNIDNSSSFVSMIKVRTRAPQAVISTTSLPWLCASRFLSVSIRMPSQSMWWQILARESASCSPMPPVKMMASTPPIAAM